MSWAIPNIGILLWCWITFLGPHKLAWNFPSALRLNLLIAIATIVGWLFSREDKTIPKNLTVFFVIIFLIHTTISATLSLAPEITWPLWNRHIKTFFLIFMIMALMNSRVRVHSLIWVIVICIGYFGVWGGILGVLTGGSYRLVGTPKSPIADNNHLALAMVITIPLMNYLRIHSEKAIVRYGLLFAMLSTIFAVLSTYSRGGLISLCAMIGFLWLKSKSKNKILILLVVGLVVVPAVQFMPDKWTARMNTIENAAESDSSFKSRLHVWETSYNIAIDRPLFGAGFASTESPHVYTKYRAPDDPYHAHAAHSIYFQLLGDLGFVGLILYFVLVTIAWQNAKYVIFVSKRFSQLEWARDLASMIQVSMVGFFVGGAALSFAYYDVVLTMFAVLEVMRSLVAKESEKYLASMSETPKRSSWRAISAKRA